MKQLIGLCIAVSLAYAERPQKSELVPLEHGCIQRITVLSWGKCLEHGSEWDCSQTHMNLRLACFSVGDQHAKQATLSVEYPAAIAPGENPSIELSDKHRKYPTVGRRRAQIRFRHTEQ